MAASLGCSYLADLRHIVYKDVQTPWQTAHVNLGLMAREGLLKENVDGEAMQWATRRLKRIKASRRILLVMSEMEPYDDMTKTKNGARYLADHMQSVIDRMVAKGDIEPRALTVDREPGRTPVVFPDIGYISDISAGLEPRRTAKAVKKAFEALEVVPA